MVNRDEILTAILSFHWNICSTVYEEGGVGGAGPTNDPDEEDVELVGFIAVPDDHNRNHSPLGSRSSRTYILYIHNITNVYMYTFVLHKHLHRNKKIMLFVGYPVVFVNFVLYDFVYRQRSQYSSRNRA